MKAGTPGAATPERNQSYPEDDILSCSQEEASHGSHVSLPPTPPPRPPTFPHREMSSISSRRRGKISSSAAFDSPKACMNSFSKILPWFGSILPLASAHRASRILVLGAVAMASCVMYPVAINRTLSFLTGCSPGLTGHLRRLGLQQHASALCSKGYHHLSDLLHMSEEQLEHSVGVDSAAHRHRLVYTSADILARQRMRMAAQESHWGPVSVILVFAIMLCTLCVLAAVVAAVAVPALRNKLAVLMAVVSTEVWYHYRHRARQNAGASANDEVPASDPVKISPQEVTSPLFAPERELLPSSDGARPPYHDDAQFHHTDECQVSPPKRKNQQRGAAVFSGLKGLRLRPSKKRTSNSDTSHISCAQPVAENVSTAGKSPSSVPSQRSSSGRSWLLRHSRRRQQSQDCPTAGATRFFSPRAFVAAQGSHNSASAPLSARRVEEIDSVDNVEPSLREMV